MSKKKVSPAIRLAIAVPTYNEAKNLPKLVAKLKAAIAKTDASCTLMIIDDNSPDGTGDIAEKLAKTERTDQFIIEVYHRTAKEGLGKAYVAGFKKLLAKDFTHILQMDADLSHDPKYIPEFIKAAEAADFVVGSRYIKGGGTPDWAWSRKLQSHLGNIYTQVLLGSTIHDYTGGFNLFSADLLGQLELDNLQASGYGFLIELKHRATKQAKAVHEVPIIFLDRIHGTSKIPKGTLVDNLILVLKLRSGSSNRETTR